MADISDRELIEKAAEVIHTRKAGDYLIGDVGCALVSDTGKIYQGVCIDAPSGMGFCAEHAAIGALITAGESKIKRIVAVWKDGTDTYVVSPCGRCREFMRAIDESNMDTEVFIAADKKVSLRELLPHAHSYIKI